MKEMDLKPGEQIRVYWTISFGYTENAVAIFKHFNKNKTAVWAEATLNQGFFYYSWDRI